MVWSHNDQWMVTGDTSGYVKYWQSNMNNVKMFQAHKDPVRGLRYMDDSMLIFTNAYCDRFGVRWSHLFVMAEYTFLFILFYILKYLFTFCLNKLINYPSLTRLSWSSMNRCNKYGEELTMLIWRKGKLVFC